MHTVTFYLLLSAFLIVAAIPLILRKVPRNRWYGLRIPRAMYPTDEDWYSLNHKAGLFLLALGILLVPAARVFHLLQP